MGICICHGIWNDRHCYSFKYFYNLGIPEGFFSIWIKTWSTTFFLAFFPAYFMRAIAIKVVKKVIHN
jgi:hypothetical protein